MCTLVNFIAIFNVLAQILKTKQRKGRKKGSEAFCADFFNIKY
jgi:hypothetical protein